VLCRGLAVRDAEGKPYRMAGSQTDVTDRKTSEEQLKHDSFYDGLSGLPNRFLFMDRLGNALLRAKRGGNYGFGILVLDLDRFQFVNDSLGHVVGDQLIIAMAHRLKSCLRPGDTMARLGGDEFAILLEDIKEAADATRVADRIHQDLETPFDLCGHEIFATTSIGIALSSTGYDQPETMLRDADTAMHRAKSMGRARHEVFDASMHTRAVSLLKLEGDLRRALERQEFRIHYQPIVSLESWKIAGFEALLRWQHPERGLVLPEEFIPLAEDTGLIIPIAKWVIQEACRQTSVWQSDFPTNPPISVSVNLSSKNLSQPDLIEEVDRALTDAGLLGQSLGLEITESALIENAEHAITVLSRLRALNIRMHVDDFGTGYSSLSYLHQFPIDSLKIDRSFVTRLPQDGQNAEIVRTIMSLARNLGLTVIAEGVETREQAESLRELDCEMAQGFFFHKPLDTEQIKALLKAKWRTHIV
jgi:diguanylate cyclase (GGDEF)-like protein